MLKMEKDVLPGMPTEKSTIVTACTCICLCASGTCQVCGWGWGGVGWGGNSCGNDEMFLPQPQPGQPVGLAPSPD